MGKWTDKNYITHSEWERDFGGAKKKATSDFKRLPFNCCALSLRPFETPVCTPDGVVFDLVNIVPYIRKFKSHPVTGEPLKETQLISLHFHKNPQGEYHDPVTFKVFNDHSHIVALRTTGNVYDYATIKSLNLDVRQLRDLLTDEPFERADIITLQDPQNLTEKHDFSKFHHIKNKIKVTGELEAALQKDAHYTIAPSVSSERLLSKLREADVLASAGSASAASTSSPAQPASPAASPAGGRPAATAAAPPKLTPSFPDKQAASELVSHVSTGRVSSSLTSTAVSVATQQERALYHADDVMYEKIKKRGYARIVTSLGNLNVELFADLTPMTCHNFILLAKRGYYRNLTFHRLVPNFMIQGGDPTGTGTGGESAWGKPFKDEFRPSLSHDARGLLCMANRGPNTNTSQFFLTLRPCTHLDRKHTVFGKVVGGADVLTKMEMVPTDGKERPREPIVIVDVIVFVDPFAEYEEEKQRTAADAAAAKEREEAMARNRQLVRPAARAGADESTVGRYIAQKRAAAAAEAPAPAASVPPAGSKRPRSDLSDFSSW